MIDNRLGMQGVVGGPDHCAEHLVVRQTLSSACVAAWSNVANSFCHCYCWGEIGHTPPSPIVAVSGTAAGTRDPRGFCRHNRNNPVSRGRGVCRRPSKAIAPTSWHLATFARSGHDGTHSDQDPLHTKQAHAVRSDSSQASDLVTQMMHKHYKNAICILSSAFDCIFRRPSLSYSWLKCSYSVILFRFRVEGHRSSMLAVSHAAARWRGLAWSSRRGTAQ